MEPTLSAALAEACIVIEALADQQAMPDHFYVEPLERFKKLVALDEALEVISLDAAEVAADIRERRINTIGRELERHRVDVENGIASLRGTADHIENHFRQLDRAWLDMKETLS